jgi:hypothetical protein
MNKAISWIVLLLGVYQILSLILVDKIPVVLDGTWGWVVGVVVLVIGALMLKKA